MQEIQYKNFPVRASKINPEGQFEVAILGITPDGLPDETETRTYDPRQFQHSASGDTIPLLEVLEERPVKPEYLFALGKVLGDLILPNLIRRRFLRSLEVVRRHDKRLRLRLVLDDPRLAALPWELIYIKELA